MTSLLIRNIDEETMDRLKARAARNGRSLQGEAKAILEANVAPFTAAEALAKADGIRERLAASGITFEDSAELIRADRDDPDR